MKSTGNTILVTGGGSGIGREYARRWHDAGNVVIVAGRTVADLEETAKGYENIHVRQLDVSDPGQVVSFAEKLVADFPALNVLMNNAGIMPYEDITQPRDLANAKKVIAINLMGPICLTDALIDHLRAAEDAAIINVTSGLAFVPMPKAATYSASKAAIHSYTVSLRKLLDGKVEVIELAPPGVQTELTPGQSTRQGYMPLEDFVSESMALLGQQPTPAEICVENVKPLRNAEANGTFAQVLDMIASR